MHAEDDRYYDEVSDAETPLSIKNKLKVRINHMVETTNTALSDETMISVVSCLDKVEVIFVFGIGASALWHKIYSKNLVESGNKFTSYKIHIF